VIRLLKKEEAIRALKDGECKMINGGVAECFGDADIAGLLAVREPRPSLANAREGTQPCRGSSPLPPPVI
jgi:hypothetical protein